MTLDEAKTVFLNRGYIEVEGGTIYDADKWREACRVISEWLEQEPTVTSTEDNAEMIYPQVEGITPTVVEPLPDVDKKIESYKKLLKHPVIKHIMGMDETQEQLDFVQSHKQIPVTLTVSGDLISRQAVLDLCKKEIDHISKNWQNYHSPSEAKSGFVYIATNIYELPSVKPQESCDVPDINDGDIISRQAAINAVSEALERTFVENEEVAKGIINKLPSVKPQEKTGHREYNGIYDHYLCGNCKTVVMDYDNYCPNCGAKLSEIPRGSESEDKE